MAIGSTHWMLLQAPQKEFSSVFVSVYHLFLCVQAPLVGQAQYLSGLFFLEVSLVAQMVKHLPQCVKHWPADLVSIPGSGRSSGEGNCNQLQYACLEIPMDGGAWYAIVHRVAKSQT